MLIEIHQPLILPETCEVFLENSCLGQCSLNCGCLLINESCHQLGSNQKYLLKYYTMIENQIQKFIGYHIVMRNFLEIVFSIA